MLKQSAMSSQSLNRVAVVASAQTQLREAWSKVQHVDLISGVVSSLLRGSGLEIKDVDVVIDCGSDVLDGRSISNCGFLGAMGAHSKEEARVEEDGLFGAAYGVNKIASGSASVALIIAYSKPSESDVSKYYLSLTEPFYQRALGIDHLTVAGLLANQYVSTHRVEDEALIRIAAASWRKAAENKYVEISSAPTFDDIASSAMLASPLRQLQIARPLDGAVAVLLATEEVARRINDRPVWVTGVGTSMDSHFIANRRPGEFEACRAAASMATRKAGIDEMSIFGLAEVSASSSASEAMVVESLGFAEPGRAIDCYGEGLVMELNPSGGSIPADPIMATGLVRLHDAASRLAGRIGHTVATRALVHGAGGLGMQNHCVFTLEV